MCLPTSLRTSAVWWLQKKATGCGKCSKNEKEKKKKEVSPYPLRPDLGSSRLTALFFMPYMPESVPEACLEKDTGIQERDESRSSGIFPGTP